MSKKTNFGKINGREAMVVGIIIVMVALFSILSPTFRTYSTFVSVLDMSYYIALMAIGVTFTLIVHKDVPVVVSLIACLVLSILIGALNGLLVAIMDLPPFLATLCTCMITRGLGSLLSGGFGVSWPSSLEPEGWFRKIFRFTVNGKVIPIGIVVVVVLVLLMNFILKHTKIGRYTIAIGSNKEATKLAGVNVKFYHVFAYVISGFFAGLAAIAYSATYVTIYPGSGAGFELDAIGGAIVGGVSASGGVGTITGAFLGVLVITLMKVGLPFIGLQANWQQIFTGLVLIGAVLIDVVKKKK